MMTNPTARPVGRPRSQRAERAILEATLDLLVEEAGVAGVSIEAVAARAGVGKTTIYRRWPNKEQLIIDAMASLKPPLVQPAGTGGIRADLLEILESVRPGHDPRADVLWNIFGSATRHPELARQYRTQVIEPRREVLREVFQRGVDAGELAPGTDIEVAISMAVGSVSMRAKSYDPDGRMPADFPARVVDTLLDGIRAR